jgi:hypothetical protein
MRSPIDYYRPHKYFQILVHQGLNMYDIEFSKPRHNRFTKKLYNKNDVRVTYKGYSATGKPKYALLEAWRLYNNSL